MNVFVHMYICTYVYLDSLSMTVTGAGDHARPSTAPAPRRALTGARKVSFCKCQFLHKTVSLIFQLVMRNNKLTDLCGN